MMRRKDFKAIAEIIREHKLSLQKYPEPVKGEILVDIYHLAEKFEQYFRTNNPTFNREKFMKACGYYGDV